MYSARHTPQGPLGEFVQDFWMCSDGEAPHGREQRAETAAAREQRAETAAARERIVPRGTVELVFNLREDEVRIYDPEDVTRCTRYAGAVVSGTYPRAFAIDPRQHAGIVGVHFRPGGAARVLGAPAGEFTERHVDLGCLWGAAAVSELRERLCAAATPEA